jgi:hypothetical protein
LTPAEKISTGLTVVSLVVALALSLSADGFHPTRLAWAFFALAGVLLVLTVLWARRPTEPNAPVRHDIPAQPPTERHTTAEITAAWNDVERRFSLLAGQGIDAGWERLPSGEDRWFLVCGSRQHLRSDVEAVCKLAASTLTRFPKVRAGLADDVLREPNPEYQWYRCLKQFGEFRDDGGEVFYGQSGKSNAGSVKDLPAVSARKCVECLAFELNRE